MQFSFEYHIQLLSITNPTDSAIFFLGGGEVMTNVGEAHSLAPCSDKTPLSTKLVVPF
jgi:hypothetical protein